VQLCVIQPNNNENNLCNNRNFEKKKNPQKHKILVQLAGCKKKEPNSLEKCMFLCYLFFRLMMITILLNGDLKSSPSLVI
jgi:hypothetical protein